MQSSPLAAFVQLPQLEQRALTALLAMHRPLTRSDFARVLRDLGVRDARGRQLSTTDLLAMLEGWRGARLAVETPSGWAVDRGVMHALAGDLAARDELAEAALGARKLEPLIVHYTYGVRPERVARELFLALYAQRDEFLDQALGHYRADRHGDDSLYVHAWGAHVPHDVLARAGGWAATYLDQLLPLAAETLVPVGDGVLAYARRSASASARAAGAQYLALRGAGDDALELLGSGNDSELLAARAFVLLSKGDLAGARAVATEAVESTRTKSSKRVKGLVDPLWPWVCLLLLTDRSDPHAGALAEAQLAVSRKRRETDQAVAALQVLGLAGGEHVDALLTSFLVWSEYAESWTDVALWKLAIERSGRPALPRILERRQGLRARAEARGFAWLAQLLHEGLPRLLPKEAPWERALRTLEVAIAQSTPSEQPKLQVDERIVWVVRLYGGQPALTPRLQTRKGERYTSGRAVSMKRLSELGPDDALLDLHDRRVLAHLAEVRDPGDWSATLQLAPEAALSLVGHARVFADEECTRPLSLERGRPSVQVRPKEQGWVVEAEPAGCAEVPVYGVQTGDDRIVLYALSSEQKRVVKALPRGGLVLPAEARDAAQQTLGKLARLFPLSSALELDASVAQEVAADVRIHVQLRRTRAGMRVSLYVAPLGGAVRVLPSVGDVNMIGVRDGVTVRCVRDLAKERAELAEVAAALRLPDDEENVSLADLVDCLEVISALQALGERVVVEWPEGAPLTIAAQRDAKQLKVRIGEQGAWLSAEGELPVDAALTLGLRDLIARKHARHGRFIALDDGRFVALSEALQKTIESAEAHARVDDAQVLLHPLSIHALAQLDGAAMEVTPSVERRLGLAREAAVLAPVVPAAFQATLRPYQVEGYAFLRRHAHWQAGACLADDMGLGKTLQALALLVARAEGGPALVVAPTSVCSNWIDEAAKFAPTLRVKQLASDRERTLRELVPGDLLVCSYGVLQQERALLASVGFHTAILDEAQAIKNARTQRAQAAFALQAEQRIALTGTPVENHLGELWSVLHFINPGLLGSEREFEQRFARPIQRDGDKARAALLRRLTAPFVLRRKKADVLHDLPAKTEITLCIEPSAEERALYKALREEAVARVQSVGKPGAARMQLFAELMRMRRAACHPKLVLEDSTLESSKLAALEELLEELRDNDHRALVFSQFVDHLTLVRARLDALGVSYQYLDGSSSRSARANATSAFQRGEGDVFLISLKAGGFGLNLTGADYVIHLDPWWNPAVEDQASDRAHRIGQTRPVTIYRLLMRGSIEEKILSLHANKRQLADEVLAGNDTRATLDVDELLGLLAEANA